MKRSGIFAAAILSALALPATAAVNIDWVTVGDINNPADSMVMYDGTTGYGSVGYAYQIGKYEVTNAQYAAFLNAAAKTDTYGLYSTYMASETVTAGISRSGSSGSYSYAAVAGSENKPIAYVSWFDAARFCNWLQNGQDGGNTETGAYTLNGAVSGIITKNVGATVWIPSEDEWYKAAYYDPNKGGAGVRGYWWFPTQSNLIGGNTVGVANNANYYDGANYGGSGNGFLPAGKAHTDVGAYGVNSESAYGTNDQGGNVWEWNDAVIGSSRGLRGGSWLTYEFSLVSSNRDGVDPLYESYGGSIGFRVASVPEPTSLVLTMFAGVVMLVCRKR